MNVTWIKRPGSLLDHSFGWEAELRADGEAVAADLGWTIDPLRPRTGGITVRGTQKTSTTTTAFLAGGAAGETYRLTNRIRTTTGREIERRTTIRIGNS